MKNMVTIEQRVEILEVHGSSGTISSPTEAARGPGILISASQQQWLPAAPFATVAR